MRGGQKGVEVAPGKMRMRSEVPPIESFPAAHSAGKPERPGRKVPRPQLLVPRAPVAKRWGITAALFGFGCFLLIWQGLSQRYAEQGKAVLLPSPQSVWEATLDYTGWGPEASRAIEKAGGATALSRSEIARIRTELRDQNLSILLGDVRISFVRVTSAFLFAGLLGVPIGVLMGTFRLFESFLQPLTEFIRYVPVPALIPVLIVLFGIDETPKIMLIFIGTFFQLVLMVADEVRRVPVTLLHVCYTLGGSRIEAVTRVLARAALPGIFDALRLCNGWAWTWLIVAELVAANEGLGFRIVKYQRFLQTDQIFVYLILLGLIGLGLDMLFRVINRRLFGWAEGGRA